MGPSAVRRFRSLSVILSAALAASACQTAARSGSRDPAAAGPDPKLLALAERDAIEAIGLYSHHLVLGRVVDRAEFGKKLAKPEYDDYNLSSVLAGTIAMPLGAALATSLGFVITQSGDDVSNPYGVIAAAGGAAILIAGTVVFTSNHYGEPSSSSGSGGSTDPRNNSFAFLQKSLRPGSVRRIEEAAAARKNSELQAGFVSGLKETARKIAERTAALFHLNAIETTQLAIRIEPALLQAFRAQEAWRPGDELKVDIPSLLQKVVPDADRRLAALGRVVIASDPSAREVPATNAELAAWFEASAAEFRKLERAAADGYYRTHSEQDPKLRTALRQYEDLARELDAFADRLGTHAKLARSSAGG